MSRSRVAQNAYGSDTLRWVAVTNRDPQADGQFVYCVHSTGIYCRPICKARLARRANVSFCSDAQLAEKEGFRACKRCKPATASLMPEDKAVIRIKDFVSDGPRHIHNWRSLDDMATQTGLSKWHFHRVFKKVVGMTPVEYARSIRTAQVVVSPESSDSVEEDHEYASLTDEEFNLLEKWCGDFELDSSSLDISLPPSEAIEPIFDESTQAYSFINYEPAVGTG